MKVKELSRVDKGFNRRGCARSAGSIAAVAVRPNESIDRFGGTANSIKFQLP